MPNIKSAKKRLRRSLDQRSVNMPRKSRMRSCRRAFREAVETGDRDASATAFRGLCSSLDKAAKSGAIEKNTAVRGKSRAAARLRALSGG